MILPATLARKTGFSETGWSFFVGATMGTFRRRSFQYEVMGKGPFVNHESRNIHKNGNGIR